MEVSELLIDIKDQATRINTVDLVFNVVKEVSGNDISTTINNNKITKHIIKSMIDNRLVSLVEESNFSNIEGSYSCYSPKEGTILNSLTDASIPLISEVNNSENNTSHSIYELVENNIKAMREVNGKHSVLMDEYVELLSRVVSGHIKLAKTIVLPEVKNLVELYNDYRNQYIPTDRLSHSNIIIYDKPELLDNDEVREIIEKYDGAALIPHTDSINLGMKSFDEIVLGCTTGDKRLDDSIIEYLNSVPSVDVYSAYNYFFNSSDSDITYEEILKLNGYDRFIYGLVGLIYSRKLIDNIPDDINMSLKDYMDVVSSITNLSGALMFTSVEIIESYIRSEVLLLGNVNFENLRICVNGPIYREWIKHNDEELVIAAGASNRPRYTVSNIEDHKEELLNELKTITMLNDIEKKDNFLRNSKDYLYDIVCNSETTEIEKEYFNDHNDYITKVKDKTTKYLSTLSGLDLEDIDTVCLDLMTKCRFYFTSANTILSAMCDAYKVNSDLDPREAALLSVVNYLVEYMSGQINVSIVHKYPRYQDPKLDHDTNVSINGKQTSDDVEPGIEVTEGS